MQVAFVNKRITRERSSRLFITLPVLCLFLLPLTVFQVCYATDGVNNNAFEIDPDGTVTHTTDTTSTTTATQNHQQIDQQKVCNVHRDVCTVASTSQLYQRGTGSAMAYKPNQPDQKIIYHEDPEREMYNPPEGIPWDDENWNDIRKYENKMFSLREYNIADNPIARSSYPRKTLTPPKLAIFVNVYKCNAINHDQQPCCCQPLTTDADTDSGSSSEKLATVDLWHAYPNGTYPSLRKGIADGVCRAKRYVRKDGKNQLSFFTLSPGSTGFFHGIFPNGLDIQPYGPPVIHILVRPKDPSYDDLLVDIPILYKHEEHTLEQGEFWGNDYRPQAWFGNKGPLTTKDETKFYTIRSWEWNPHNRLVQIHIDLFLQPLVQSSDQQQKTKKLCTKKRKSITEFSPKSFYLEPLAVCSPKFIDYLRL